MHWIWSYFEYFVGFEIHNFPTYHNYEPYDIQLKNSLLNPLYFTLFFTTV